MKSTKKSFKKTFSLDKDSFYFLTWCATQGFNISSLIREAIRKHPKFPEFEKKKSQIMTWLPGWKGWKEKK